MKFLQKTQRTVMLLLKVLLFFILFATFLFFRYWKRMAAAPFENRRGNHAYVCRSRLGTYVNIRRIFRGNNKEQAYNLLYDALHRIYRYCNSFAALHNEHKCGKQPKIPVWAPLLLLLVMVIQILVIIFFAYFGNFVYFSINSPEKCCVITTSKYSLNNIIPKIKKYKSSI